MSDDLVKRLRSQVGDDVSDFYSHEALFRLAAERIEELEARAEAAEAERDEAISALSEEGRKRGKAEAEVDRLQERLADTPALVLEALAEIATQATLAMSDGAVRSVTLAQGDDPDLVAERVRAIIQAALRNEKDKTDE